MAIKRNSQTWCDAAEEAYNGLGLIRANFIKLVEQKAIESGFGQVCDGLDEATDNIIIAFFKTSPLLLDAMSRVFPLSLKAIYESDLNRSVNVKDKARSKVIINVYVMSPYTSSVIYCKERMDKYSLLKDGQDWHQKDIAELGPKDYAKICDAKNDGVRVLREVIALKTFIEFTQRFTIFLNARQTSKDFNTTENELMKILEPVAKFPETKPALERLVSKILQQKSSKQKL